MTGGRSLLKGFALYSSFFLFPCSDLDPFAWRISYCNCTVVRIQLGHPCWVQSCSNQTSRDEHGKNTCAADILRYKGWLDAGVDGPIRFLVSAGWDCLLPFVIRPWEQNLADSCIKIQRISRRSLSMSGTESPDTRGKWCEVCFEDSFITLFEIHLLFC